MVVLYYVHMSRFKTTHHGGPLDRSLCISPIPNMAVPQSAGDFPRVEFNGQLDTGKALLSWCHPLVLRTSLEFRVRNYLPVFSDLPGTPSFASNGLPDIWRGENIRVDLTTSCQSI